MEAAKKRNIKHIDSIEGLKEPLKDVKIGEPLYLRDEQGVKYVLVDAQDYRRLLTALQAINQL